MQNNLIQKFTSDGTFLTSWGSGGSGNGQFNLHFGIAVDSSSTNRVYVADDNNHPIQVFAQDINTNQNVGDHMNQ